MTFYTSDTHYWHKKMLEKCRDIFSSVEDMNEYLVELYNKTVGPTDTVWFLGDVSFGRSQESRDIVHRLNGVKHLIRGNHDGGDSKMLKMGFASVHDQAVVSVCGTPFLLSHCPYREGQIERHIKKYGEMYTEKKGNLPLICGHVHGEWLVRGNMINVGVDVWNYYPVSETRLWEMYQNHINGVAQSSPSTYERLA